MYFSSRAHHQTADYSSMADGSSHPLGQQHMQIPNGPRKNLYLREQKPRLARVEFPAVILGPPGAGHCLQGTYPVWRLVQWRPTAPISATHSQKKKTQNPKANHTNPNKENKASMVKNVKKSMLVCLALEKHRRWKIHLDQATTHRPVHARSPWTPAWLQR